MSLFSSITKRSTLDAAIKQVAKARKTQDADQAEQLFAGAYQGFAKVIADNLMFSEALYHWGFGLLHQARNLQGEEAVAAYEDAISKFSFCLLTNPNFLGAAIDGGVAIMELARISAQNARKDWYRLAEDFFLKANQIQKGSASYNLACIESLRGNDIACQAALREAKSFGSLPELDLVLADVDMEPMANAAWFKDLIEEFRRPPEQEAEQITEEAQSVEPSFKIKKMEEFDYYAETKPQPQEQEAE